ncbi:hypothetical protein Hanom_Chr14g01291301 [Helianthus anomalus]
MKPRHLIQIHRCIKKRSEVSTIPTIEYLCSRSAGDHHPPYFFLQPHRTLFKCKTKRFNFYLFTINFIV